ncbi:hypothetical protein [Actinomadura litoris]|uniref:hypothetical protein n=1 Tax=Actinomadura litoris TaxID=2678616 RepID=UPI001FA77AF6|nr:hypothetical protein [Actinomadura litoris]
MSDAPAAPTTPAAGTGPAPADPAANPAAPSPAALAARLEAPGSGESEPPAEGEDRAAEVAKLRRENAGWRTKFREAETRLAELESAAQTDAEKALNAARAEAIAETTAKFNAKLVAAEVRSLAAELRFRDPADAARLVDTGGIEPGPDGEIDTVAIGKALKAVAEAKPYLIDSAPAIPTAREVGLGATGGEPATGYDGYSVADFDREFFGTT